MNKSDTALETDKLFEFDFCKSEFEFWKDFEKRISKKRNIQIIDREKYTLDKIEKSKLEGDSSISYGIICIRPSYPDICFRIYSNSINRCLRYGFGIFEKEFDGMWEWSGAVEPINNSSERLFDFLDFNKIISNKSNWKDTQNYIIRCAKKAKFYGFFND